MTHVPPYPASSGDAVRNLNLMRQLSERNWRVSLFALTPGGSIDDAARNKLLEVCDDVVAGPTPDSSRALRVALSTLRRQPFQPDYFWNDAASAILKGHLATNRYDLHMMQLAYMCKFAESSHTPFIFDTHNAERNRLASMVSAGRLSPRGIAARLQMRSSEKLEERLSQKAARTLAVSLEDHQYFERFAPGKVEFIPNGVDLESRPFRSRQPASNNLLFLGSLDYSANVDAVRHLATSILPQLAMPVHVDVLGRNPPPALTALRLNSPLQFHGFVEDLDPFVQSSRAMVVPLRFGGGTRLKILDAFAMGIPVVSTSIGCAGLDAIDGKHLLIADEPRAFAAAIERLMTDDSLCHRLTVEAHTLTASRYDWRILGARLDHALEATLDGLRQGPQLGRLPEARSRAA